MNSAKDLILKFQLGIINHDGQAVEEALRAGVSADALLPGHVHPMEYLLFPERHDGGLGQIRDGAGDRGAAQRIVKMLLGHGADLLSSHRPGATGSDTAPLIDRLLPSSHTESLIEIILQAVLQSFKKRHVAYAPDTAQFVARQIDTMQDGRRDERTIEAAIKSLQMLRISVRTALKNGPHSPVETELLEKYPGKLDYWTKPSEIHFDPTPEFFDAASVHSSSAPPVVMFQFEQKKEPEATRKADKDNEMEKYIKLLEKKQPEAVLSSLDDLVGMEQAKEIMHTLYSRQRLEIARSAEGLKNIKPSLHGALTGNPGTGKTTLAKHYAELMHSLGLIGNRYAEVTRETMVGQYIGQTEKKVTDLFAVADFIFIDEAYSLLVDGRDYGKQIIDALMTALENRRDNLVVFFAGYPEEIDALLSSNPGFKSRIKYYCHMPDYTAKELGQILDKMLTDHHYTIDADARRMVLRELNKVKEDMGPRGFGNGRVVRSIVERLPDVLSRRLFGKGQDNVSSASREELSTIRLADIKALKITKMFSVQGVPLLDQFNNVVDGSEMERERANKVSFGFQVPVVKKTARKKAAP